MGGGKIVLAIALALLTLFVFSEPGPVWFFPLFLLVYLFRQRIAKIFARVKANLPKKYFLFGLATGLLIELLAIVNSTKLPAEQRALFHPEPFFDLVFALGYYSALTLGSYFVLKRQDFSLKQFFATAGFFGLAAEQHGLVFLQLLSGNILGAIYVFLSYGSFLAMPYLLFQQDFSAIATRRKGGFLKYFIALLVWVVSYALFLLYFLLVSRILGT